METITKILVENPGLNEHEIQDLLEEAIPDYREEYLREMFEAADTPIRLVLDENGENMENGQYREVAGGYILYADDVDGFNVFPGDYFKNANTVLAE